MDSTEPRRINRLNIKINDDYDDKSSLQHDDYFVIAIDFTTFKRGIC